MSSPTARPQRPAGRTTITIPAEAPCSRCGRRIELSDRTAEVVVSESGAVHATHIECPELRLTTRGRRVLTVAAVLFAVAWVSVVVGNLMMAAQVLDGIRAQIGMR